MDSIFDCFVWLISSRLDSPSSRFYSLIETFFFVHSGNELHQCRARDDHWDISSHKSSNLLSASHRTQMSLRSAIVAGISLALHRFDCILIFVWLWDRIVITTIAVLAVTHSTDNHRQLVELAVKICARKTKARMVKLNGKWGPNWAIAYYVISPLEKP